MPDRKLNELRGLVATVCTSDIKPQFAQCMSNMRDWNTRNGFLQVEYKHITATLVESGRDAAVRHMLSPSPGEASYDWLLQIDADATFPQDTLARLLQIAYVTHPHFEVISAYATLKGWPNLPTIDTGTGTWEEHYPGEGVLEVMRTGAHCLLTKEVCFRRLGLKGPWFRTKLHIQPAHAIADVDTFIRTKMHGKNPLTDHDEWATIVNEARACSDGTPYHHVGEDSGFCDRLTSLGGRIAVDTDLPTGHIGTQMFTANTFKDNMTERRLMARQMLGIGEL